MMGALRQRPLARVVQGIVQADNGTILEVNDMSYLYQDAAGTIPVTAVEQPVGKILDKSGKGNHATQSVTASRPTLSARYNLLTKTEDFSDAAWTKYGITLSQALGPNGVTGAYKITEDLTTGTHRLSQAVSSSASSYIVYIKNDGANYCAVSWRGNSDIRYDVVSYNLLTKSKIMLQDASGLYVSDSIVDVGDGWLKITVTLKSAAQFHVACANPTKDPSYLVSYTGDGVSGLIVYHPQVSPSVTTPYQRVNTATDYDANPAFFPKYLKFDGIDDYLNLPFMGLYANGSASVVVATTVKPSTWSTILAEGTYYHYGLYILARYTATNKLGTFIQADNANLLRNLETPITQGVTTVLSVVDAGSAVTHWVSSMLTGSSNYTRSSTLTSAVTLVGARPYTDTLNGNLYGLIITKSALTDAQRVKCERFLARKAGVQL